MGDIHQLHVTMLITGEQKDAIKLMFLDKNWPCCLNVLSAETVAGIIQSGFTDVFPVPAGSPVGGLSCSVFTEIKSEIVNLDVKENSTDEPLDLHVTFKAPNISDNEDSASDVTIENNFTMSESESPDKSNASTVTDSGKMVRKRCKRASFTDKSGDGQVKIKKKFKCLHCDMSLASKPSLLRHCQRRHQDVWCEFKCKDCSCMFKTKEELWAHRNKVKHEPPKVKPKFSEKKNHSPEELAEMGHVKCNACGKYLPSKRLLRRHFYSDHRELMPDPICAVCNMEFKTRQELWTHKREMKHNDSLTLLDTYQCDNCGKILTGGYHSFKLHQKYVCEKKQDAGSLRATVPCDICGTAFKSDEHLRRHKQIVHEKSPEICDICGTVFKNRHSVTRHKRRHNEKNRKYVCSECGKAFFTGLLLRDHMRTHTKEKPWKCTLCSHTCAIKQNLQKHALNVHKVQLKAADLIPLTVTDLSQANEKKCDSQRIEVADVLAMNASYKEDDAETQEELPTFITMQTHSEKRQESVQDINVVNKQNECMRRANENDSLKCAGTSPSSSYMELMIAGIDPVQYQHQWGNPTC